MTLRGPGSVRPRPSTIIAVVIVALITVAGTLVLALVPKSPGIFGWNTGADGTTVISVTPGLPADKAGIREGDKIDFASLPLTGRVNTVLTFAVYSGALITFRYTHEGQQRVARLRAIHEFFDPLIVISFVGGVLVVAVGIGLVLLRPGRMTWGFLLIGLAQVLIAFSGPNHNEILYLISTCLLYIWTGLGLAGMMIFASRFPTDTASGWLRFLDRAAVPWFCSYTASIIYIGLDLLWSSKPPSYVAIAAYEYVLPAIAAISALLALITTAVRSPGSTRQRLIPVMVMFALWVSLATISAFGAELFTTKASIQIIPVCSAAAMTLFAVAVAYGVIRHRVIDVSFIISRAVVYTILTAILIGVFALIDFLVSKWLEQSQLALILEIAAALALGFWLNAIHGRVDRFVDNVLFRRRHLAEKRLARVAKMLPHATSAKFVDESLVVEPVGALDLASGAVFRRAPNGSFTKRFDLGWTDGCTTSIDENDHLVIQLEAELDSLNMSDVRWPRTDVPTGLQQPLLAVPFAIRHRVEAFALYSGHVGGEALDPDEIRCLRDLATPAAAAYDHLKADDLREQLERLRADNEKLQLGQQVNVGMLEMMRQQMEAINELLRRQPSI